MKLTTDNVHTTRAMKCDLATLLSDLERVLHRATVGRGGEAPLLPTVLAELAGMNNQERDPSFTVRVMAEHTVTKINEYMTCNAVESSDTSSYKWQSLLKSVIIPPSDMKRKIGGH